MGRMFVVLHYYKLIGRNNYPLLLVLILNLVLGVLILFVCKRDITDISRIPSHCSHTVTILLISSLCLYKWTWPSWPDISDSLNTYISVPITVSFGLLPSFHRAWSLHWKIIQFTTLCMFDVCLAWIVNTDWLVASLCLSTQALTTAMEGRAMYVRERVWSICQGLSEC